MRTGLVDGGLNNSPSMLCCIMALLIAAHRALPRCQRASLDYINNSGEGAWQRRACLQWRGKQSWWLLLWQWVVLLSSALRNKRPRGCALPLCTTFTYVFWDR